MKCIQLFRKSFSPFTIVSSLICSYLLPPTNYPATWQISLHCYSVPYGGSGYICWVLLPLRLHLRHCSYPKAQQGTSSSWSMHITIDRMQFFLGCWPDSSVCSLPGLPTHRTVYYMTALFSFLLRQNHSM